MSVSPWTEAYQAALSFTIFLSLLKFTGMRLVWLKAFIGSYSGSTRRTTFSIMPVHWRSSHPQMKHLSLLKRAPNILYLGKPLPSSPDPGVIYLNSGTEPRKRCTPFWSKASFAHAAAAPWMSQLDDQLFSYN